MKIGITGQNGFIGYHLTQTINYTLKDWSIVPFKRSFLDDSKALDFFVSSCDVIVHLAAMNRHENMEVLYKTNMDLVEQLISSLERTKSKAHVLFSSSSQEDRDNLYGKSKKDGRILLERWAKTNGGKFTGLVIPNVFGPFGQPNYNSVVATFSHKLANGEKPVIQVDGELKLIYVNELAEEIINKIKGNKSESLYQVPHTSIAKVSEILSLLKKFKECYQDKGEIPTINNTFELNLFNTYRCYMDIKNTFDRTIFYIPLIF